MVQRDSGNLSPEEREGSEDRKREEDDDAEYQPPKLLVFVLGIIIFLFKLKSQRFES